MRTATRLFASHFALDKASGAPNAASCIPNGASTAPGAANIPSSATSSTSWTGMP